MPTETNDPGQDPQTTTPAGDPESPSSSESSLSREDALAALEAARREAAKYRTERNQYRDKVGELEPAAKKLAKIEDANKTESERLAERLAQLEQKSADAERRAERAEKRAKLAELATRAGVSPEVLPLLNVDAIDLEDEEAAIKALSALSNGRPSGGSPADPEMDEEALRAEFFGGKSRPHIFGG